jgi:hypothetical protein
MAGSSPQTATERAGDSAYEGAAGIAHLDVIARDLEQAVMHEFFSPLE